MNPNIDAFIKEARQFAEAQAKPKVRRVKIEKVNQAYQVRFLPVGLGDNNLWFLQQGMHWHSRKFHIYCPRCVSVDFGGNPDAECPVCDLAEDLNNSSSEEISSFGFKLRANLQYLTYCLVFQYDPGRGDVEEFGLDEVLKPWEFAHYKSSFDELVDYFRRGVTPKRPFSVLDLEAGNDFWATKTTKGIRLQKVDERTPILPLDENYDRYVDQIFKSIVQPKITIPTLKELEAYAAKAEAAASGADEGRPVSRRGRVEEDVEAGGEEDESVRPARRLPRNSRRMANPSAPPAEDAEPEAEAEEAAEPAENGEAEDQVPGAEVPARRAVPARTAAPAARTAAPAARTAAPAARTAATAAAPARTAAPAARTAAPARAATGTAARPAAPARTVAPARTAAPAARTAAPARPAARPAAAAQSSVDEEEDPGVAEEAVDNAPPTDEALPEDAQTEETAQAEETAQEEAPAEEAAQEEAAAEEEAPPQPTAKPGRAAAPVNAGLKNRLLNRARTA